MALSDQLAKLAARAKEAETRAVEAVEGRPVRIPVADVLFMKRESRRGVA